MEDATCAECVLPGPLLEQIINEKSDLKSPLIDVVSAELSNLPPTTVITAGIDPLRSDGEKLVTELRKVGVAVEHRNYDGATHEFFGMADAVAAARDAAMLAWVWRLRAALHAWPQA